MYVSPVPLLYDGLSVWQACQLGQAGRCWQLPSRQVRLLQGMHQSLPLNTCKQLDVCSIKKRLLCWLFQDVSCCPSTPAVSTACFETWKSQLGWLRSGAQHLALHHLQPPQSVWELEERGST